MQHHKLLVPSIRSKKRKYTTLDIYRIFQSEVVRSGSCSKTAIPMVPCSFANFSSLVKSGRATFLSSCSPKLPHFGQLTERNKKKRPPKEAFFLPQNSSDAILSAKKYRLVNKTEKCKGAAVLYQSFNPSISFHYSTTLEAVKSNLIIHLSKNPLLLCHSFQCETFGAPGCKREQCCQQLKSSTIPCFYLSPHTELTQAGIKNTKTQPSWYT